MHSSGITVYGMDNVEVWSMSKLLQCLGKLQSINNESTEYSVAMAQDIEAAKKELWKLGCMATACAEDYPESTTMEEHMLLDEIATELVDYAEEEQ